MEPTVSRSRIERALHALFEAGVFLKAFNGAWELLTGLAILLLSRNTMMHWFGVLSHRELIEDPHDRLMDVVNGVLTTSTHGTQLFVALYILFHGLLNLFLAYYLFRNRLWAYPAAAAAISFFLIYQFHRIFLYHSKFLIGITIIDIVFLALLMHEYYHQRQSRVAE